MDECGHYTCINCFWEFITNTINDGAECVIKTCPSFKCPNIVPPKYFLDERINNDPKLIDWYSKFLVQNFVESNKSCKYCPSPGCEFIIINPRVGAGTTDVFCDCGYGFCFKCDKDAHVPLDCYYWDLFEQKMKEDSGASDNSELWVWVNTKKCPKCQTSI